MSPKSATIDLNLGDLTVSVPSDINAQSMLRLATIGGIEEGGLEPAPASELAMKSLESRGKGIIGVGQTRAWIKIAIKNSINDLLGIHVPSTFDKESQEKIYRTFQTAFWRNIHTPESYSGELRRKPINAAVGLLNVNKTAIEKVLEDLKEKIYDTRKKAPSTKSHTFSEDPEKIQDPGYQTLSSIIGILERNQKQMPNEVVNELTDLVSDYVSERCDGIGNLKGRLLTAARSAPHSEALFSDHFVSDLEVKAVLKGKLAFVVDNDFGPPSVIVDPIIRLHSLMGALETGDQRTLLRDPKFLSDLKLLKDEWQYL